MTTNDTKTKPKTRFKKAQSERPISHLNAKFQRVNAQFTHTLKPCQVFAMLGNGNVGTHPARYRGRPLPPINGKSDAGSGATRPRGYDSQRFLYL